MDAGSNPASSTITWNKDDYPNVEIVLFHCKSTGYKNKEHQSDTLTTV
jgi:hypothetical protein